MASFNVELNKLAKNEIGPYTCQFSKQDTAQREEKIKVEHYGLSGGGLWYTAIELKGDKFVSEAYLIGIMGVDQY